MLMDRVLHKQLTGTSPTHEVRMQGIKKTGFDFNGVTFKVEFFCFRFHFKLSPTLRTRRMTSTISFSR